MNVVTKLSCKDYGVFFVFVGIDLLANPMEGRSTFELAAKNALFLHVKTRPQYFSRYFFRSPNAIHDDKNQRS